MGVRRAMDEVLPPLIKRVLNRALHRAGFYGDYPSFEAAAADSTGYDCPSIAQAVAAQPPREISIEIHTQTQHVLAAMAPALIGRDRVSVLDVGGANGSYYYALRPLIPVTWTILETPAMTRACANGSIRYVDDPDQLEPSYDVVLLGGVLQYLSDPYAALSRFAQLGPSLIITRLPLHTRERLTVQRAALYAARYPAWFFDEAQFLRASATCGTIQMRWRSLQDTVLLDGHRIALQGMMIRR